MKQIPVCPKCQEKHTLKLTDDMKIRCYVVAGGCGALFDLDELPSLYREDTGELPRARKRRKERKA